GFGGGLKSLKSAPPGPRRAHGAVPEGEGGAGQGVPRVQAQTGRVPEEAEGAGGGRGRRRASRGGPAASRGPAAAERGAGLGEQIGGAEKKGEEHALERRHAEQRRLQQGGFLGFFIFLGCFPCIPPRPGFWGGDLGSGDVARPRRASSTSSPRRRRRRRSRRRRSTKASWRDTRSRSNISKHALMEQVAHQTIVMQFILELAKSLKVDPRACFRQFFTKIKTADQQYMEGFTEELEAFKERVRGRAKVRVERALREYEEQERQKRLGPGGLDPVEVYESLPPELQKCFDVKDVQLLQDTISKMDPTEAKYHMQRCIDSGLWVPNAKGGDKSGEGAEAVYEEIPKETPKESGAEGKGKA
uniref:Uncharacterized protein n=1 Tax=Anas zonorhyncha TaxID=75864 RepID=A0A8C0A0H3_9AVES